MFYKSFYKKAAAVLTSAALLCSLAGCGKKETGSSATESVSSVPQSVYDESSEAAGSDNGDASVPQSAPDAELNDNREEGLYRSNAASRKELQEPLTPGSFTVEPPVYPWNDDDVKTAWSMTYYYDIMTTFSDCVFLDFTGDDIPEMLMLSDGVVFYIFKKDGDDVLLFAESKVDPHILNGAFMIGPPMEEDEFDFAGFSAFEPNKNFSRDKFAVYEDSGKQRYIVIYSWSGTLGMTCEIKRIEIQDGVISFPVVYRWGLFKEMGYDSINMVMRYKKHLGDDEYEEVSRQEIEDYLKSLKIVTEVPLK